MIYCDSTTLVEFAGKNGGQFFMARCVRQGCLAGGFLFVMSWLSIQSSVANIYLSVYGIRAHPHHQVRLHDLRAEIKTLVGAGFGVGGLFTNHHIVYVASLNTVLLVAFANCRFNKSN